MAATATVTEQTDKNLWGGGVSPLKVGYGKVMMWFFLLSDAFTFSGLLIAYGYIRFSHLAYTGNPADFVPSQEYWPVPEKIFDAFPFMHGVPMPLAFVGLMTFILILSSVTMVLAVEAGHRMDKKEVQKWMLWTVLGGITFLGCQAWEWSHFIHGSEAGLTLSDGTKIFGASLAVNEYGPQVFADLFFFITGFHGMHVLSGVVINLIIMYQVTTGVMERRGHYNMIEKVGLYWHFVDLVWVFVFTFFYLI